MNDVQILVLALVQGLTSSCRYPAVRPPDPRALSVQVLPTRAWRSTSPCTQFADRVIAYFRRDIWQIAGVAQRPAARPTGHPIAQPVGLGGDHWHPAGGRRRSAAEIAGRGRTACAVGDPRSPRYCSACCWVGRPACERVRDIGQLTLRDALLIGASQVLALVPGTSRSGITMTVGLWLGLTAGRGAFLVPAGDPDDPGLGDTGYARPGRLQRPVDWSHSGAGRPAVGIAAYLAIFYFLRFIEAHRHVAIRDLPSDSRRTIYALVWLECLFKQFMDQQRTAPGSHS